MNITVVGGGNVGTLIAGQLTLKGNKVTIYTRDVSKWSNEITILDKDVEKEYVYTPFKITDNICEAVFNADIIFITLPAFAIKNFIMRAEKNIKDGAWIGFYPGTGGNEIICENLLNRKCVIFGLQRICSVVRLKEYGKYVVTSGKRNTMYIGVLPISQGERIRKLFSELFEIDTILLPNYLNVTLTPSNPILHPSRLYSIFKDYYSGKVYDKIPLFYEDWTNETSKILINCDHELHTILNKMSLDTSYIRPLLEHYESTNYVELTNKIHSIRGFKGLETPSKRMENGFIPDLNSRYFTADIPYGLIIIKAFGMLYSVDTPTIDTIIDWYQRIVNKEYINISSNTLGKDSVELNLPQLYGIDSDAKVKEFYGK